ncbi:MAG: 4'-phosphopantetheinyl transferase superfamily protein [Acidobacteria bacterium]|nr:4'-phosphopantetheinyl transferase superfamily protein [Acidobacteriota bacterium]
MLAQQDTQKHSGDLLGLWFAYTKDVPATFTDQECSRILAPDEVARSKTFRFEKDRRTYLASRLLLRNALSHHHPTQPKDWQFRTSIHGKPALYPDCNLRFNLSHSTELVACLIGSVSQVGVDVESLSRGPQIVSISSELLSAQELAQFDILPNQERYDRGLSLWTLKESYVKARGLGFSLPIRKISFLFQSQEAFQMNLDSSMNDEPSKWQFCLLNFADHRVAIAVEAIHQPRLQVCEVRLAVEPLIGHTAGESTCIDQFRFASVSIIPIATNHAHP